jgi:hypothetical protein
MAMVEHTGETIDDESTISQKLLDYGWVIPAAIGATYVAKKGYDLYEGLKSRSITSAPPPSASQMEQAIDVTAKEVSPKAEKPNPLNSYAEQKYGVPLADLEAKTGGKLKSITDIDIVGNTLQKGGNVSVNPTGAFAPKSDYTKIPVMPTDGPFFNPSSAAPQANAPTPSVQAGVETGSPVKAVQSVIAQEIDKTAGMYRNAEGKMVYPKGMSPAAISGYEAFYRQYPDIAKKLETEKRFAILGGGSGDNSLYNSYDAELAKKLRNEVNQGKMIGAHGGTEGFFNKTITPAIAAIPPESALGKELNTLKMAQEVLGKKGGSYGELGTPASIGGKKGGLVTGANIVPKTIQKGGSALLLMAMADAAKAATEGNMAPSKELGFDLATGAGMAKILGGPAALAASMAFGSVGLNPNEEKELAYRRKVGAGRGVAPPSAYMR